MFTSKGTCVYLDGELIATVWTQDVDDTRLDGESWLAMRERTKPLRDEADKKALDRAELIASALHSPITQ